MLKHSHMGVEVKFQAFLTSALQRGEWLTLCSSQRQSSVEKAGGTYWKEDWVHSALVWMQWQREENPCSYLKQNLNHSAHSKPL